MFRVSVTNLRKQTRTQSGDVVKYQLVILGFVTVAQDSCWYLATNWIIAFAYLQITYWLVHAIANCWCWYYVFFCTLSHASSYYFSFLILWTLTEKTVQKLKQKTKRAGINIALSSLYLMSSAQYPHRLLSFDRVIISCCYLTTNYEYGD